MVIGWKTRIRDQGTVDRRPETEVRSREPGDRRGVNYQKSVNNRDQLTMDRKEVRRQNRGQGTGDKDGRPETEDRRLGKWIN